MITGSRRFSILAALLTAVALGFCGPAAAAESASDGAPAADAAPSTSVPDLSDVARTGPVEMVRKTSDAVLDLIDQAQGYAKQDPERFYQQVEALLSPVVDFQSFARSVMGVYYRQASQQQFERFASTFKHGLVRTYALALTDFHDGKVVVVPPDRPPRNPDRQTVTMEIHTSDGSVYPVLYSVAKESDGRWQVKNLIVNGVNMGLTYRNQFNSAMHDPKYGGDMDKVIDAWGGLLKKEKANGQEGKSEGHQA